MVSESPFFKGRCPEDRGILFLAVQPSTWGLDRQVPLKDKNMRKVIFANGEYYHIYNRGVDKREVFLDDFDYARFIKSMWEFNTIDPIGSLYELNFRHKDLGVGPPIGGPTPKSELVQIIAYCLNPNHYHMILKQVSENGISEFMKRIGGGYTTYFNKKYDRSGALFQGRFKSIHIDTNEYLLHLSVYVNKNNFIHGYKNSGTKSPIGDLVPEFWQYSSYLDYIGKRDGKLCNKEVILGQFKNNQGSTSGSFEIEPFDNYRDFMQKTALYFKDKKEMEKYLLE